MSSVALVSFVAQFLFIYNFFYSMFRGRVAVQNPWKSNTLEWTTPVVAGHGNWPGKLPCVYRWPYDYGKPNASDDFIPQNVPHSETRSSNFSHENDLIPVESKYEDMYEEVDESKF